MKDFDFDHFARLAKEDPEGFERARRELLDRALAASTGSQQRLGAHLMFRIEATRAAAKNPLHATLLAANLMWESFHALCDALNDAANVGRRPAPKARTNATVLSFEKPRKSTGARRVAMHQPEV